jgi:hypothetical protein
MESVDECQSKAAVLERPRPLFLWPANPTLLALPASETLHVAPRHHPKHSRNETLAMTHSSFD